ncbi:hypothetical protein VPH35_020540 [Triticum aestivum]
MAASSSFPWPEPSPTREVMLCSSVGLVCIAYNLRFELKPSTTSPSGRLPRHGHGAIAVDLHHRRLPAVRGTSTTSLETTRPTLLLTSSATELTTPLSCQSKQMLESRSQTPPSTMTPTTPEVPTTTCSPLTTTRSS